MAKRYLSDYSLFKSILIIIFLTKQSFVCNWPFLGEGFLKKFLSLTKSMSPEERAKALEDDEVCFLLQIHVKLA